MDGFDWAAAVKGIVLQIVMAERRFPIRGETHQLEELSERFLTNALPKNWVCQKPSDDYGVDLRVELFDGNAHRLIEVRPHFDKVYPQSGWSAEYPKPYKRQIPDIVASAEGLTPALALANALFLAMERRG